MVHWSKTHGYDTMQKATYIENLQALLRDAVEKRVIREWSVSERYILLQRGSFELAVPILEASEYVTELLRQQDQQSKMTGP